MKLTLVVFLLVGTLLGMSPDIYPQVVGQITLKDGSILHGDIIEMVEGKLKVKAAFGAGDPFLITWEEVVNLATGESVTFVLEDGTSIKGVAEKGEPGELRLFVEPLVHQISIQLTTITAINPPKEKHVTYKANLDFGARITSGNTETTQANLLGSFSARSKRMRLILDARWYYQEDDGTVTDRNAFGNMEFNFFMTPRLYLYLGVLLEQDTFDDLNLRTAISTGPGYQFIDKGDFANPYLSKMLLQGDAGLGYFNEDRKIAPDDSYATYRWSVRWDWPVTEEVEFFHRHQGYPRIDDTNDFYINTLQGIRFKVWDGLTISLQVAYKYNNAPAPGVGNSDTKTILGVGYAYDSFDSF